MTATKESDVALLKAWRSGHKAAGDELFVRHFSTIDRFFANKASPSDVHDLIQRTFTICVERLNAFEGRSSFRTFLLGISRNVLRNYYRDKAKRQHRELDDLAVADLDPSPSSLAAARQEQRLLLAALRCVPLDAQIILELYFWEDLSGAEIAEVLGVPENTARTRLRRARLRVGEALQRLSDTPALLDSTRDNLDSWARSLRSAPGA